MEVDTACTTNNYVTICFRHVGVLGKQLFMCLNLDLWLLLGFNSSLPQLAWD
jgi:hypothetical protein